MDLGELVGMTPEIIQKVSCGKSLGGNAGGPSCLTICLESSMNRNPTHVGLPTDQCSAQTQATLPKFMPLYHCLEAL